MTLTHNSPLRASDLRLHRILKAPRALVWRCWTEAELMKPWFVPKPHALTEAIIDLRPGGQFFTNMLVNGQNYPSDGAVLHVETGHQLVFTDVMLSDWRPIAKPELGFTGIILLSDHPEGTEYTAIARHGDAEAAERHEKMGFSEGWGTVATQLEEFARSL